MNTDKSIEQLLQTHYQDSYLADNGFSKTIFNQISQQQVNKQQLMKWVFAILVIYGSIVGLCLLIFSINKPGFIELATLTYLAILSTYFWLEPEL